MLEAMHVLIQILVLVALATGIGFALCSLMPRARAARGGSGGSLIPRHRGVPEDVEVVKDLDAMVSRKIGFYLEGKLHVVPPIELETFLKANNLLSHLQVMGVRNAPIEEMVGTFAEFFQIVCPSITRDEVSKMTTAQMLSLFGTLQSQLMGKAAFDEEKKSLLSPKESSPMVKTGS